MDLVARNRCEPSGRASVTLQKVAPLRQLDEMFSFSVKNKEQYSAYSRAASGVSSHAPFPLSVASWYGRARRMCVSGQLAPPAGVGQGAGAARRQLCLAAPPPPLRPKERRARCVVPPGFRLSEAANRLEGGVGAQSFAGQNSAAPTATSGVSSAGRWFGSK